MGTARPQDTSKMVRKINTAPRLLTCSRLVEKTQLWIYLWPPAGTGTWRWTCICPRRWPCWWGRTCRQSHTGRSSQTWPELEVTRLCTRVTDIRYWHRINTLISAKPHSVVTVGFSFRHSLTHIICLMTNTHGRMGRRLTDGALLSKWKWVVQVYYDGIRQTVCAHVCKCVSPIGWWAHQAENRSCWLVCIFAVRMWSAIVYLQSRRGQTCEN